MKKIDENEFEDYIVKLRELYDDYPEKTYKEVKKSIKNIEGTNNNKGGLLGDIEFDKFALCLLAILIALVGLSNIESFGMYLFGFIFFIAGLLIAIYVKLFGIIFLFSHGGTGLCFMEVALLSSKISFENISDLPKNVYIYLGIILALIVAATIIVLLHNLSDNMKEKKYIKFIPITMYLIAFLMSGMLSHFYSFITHFKI